MPMERKYSNCLHSPIVLWSRLFVCYVFVKCNFIDGPNGVAIHKHLHMFTEPFKTCHLITQRVCEFYYSHGLRKYPAEKCVFTVRYLRVITCTENLDYN